MPPPYKLGPHLKTERERRGITAEALALAFGVSLAELERAEAGTHIALNPGLCSYGSAAALLLGIPDVYDARVVSMRSELYRLHDEDRARWTATTGTQAVKDSNQR